MRRVSVGVAAAVAVAISFAPAASAAPSGSSCPGPWTEFSVTAFSAAEAQTAFGDGSIDYDSVAEAAVVYPTRDVEAFVWSNIVEKAGFDQALTTTDKNGDGTICTRWKTAPPSIQSQYPDFSPVTSFMFRDNGTSAS